jgi:hypothetical protein
VATVWIPVEPESVEFLNGLDVRKNGERSHEFM